MFVSLTSFFSFSQAQAAAAAAAARSYQPPPVQREPAFPQSLYEPSVSRTQQFSLPTPVPTATNYEVDGVDDFRPTNRIQPGARPSASPAPAMSRRPSKPDFDFGIGK